MPKVKVGIIGCCGTIGSEIARAIHTRFSDSAKLSYFCDRHPADTRHLLHELHAVAHEVSLGELIEKSDFVVEAAAANIAYRVAREALMKDKTVLIMSVGGLIGKSLKVPLARTNGKLLIPSGAIAGVDSLLAARQAGLEKVTLVTRKPPEGLQGAPFFQEREFPKLRAREERLVFAGNVVEAVKAFPQNINVSAVLSLAGVGADKTRVEIWTSRKYRHNQHEVSFESKAGTVTTVTSNRPSPKNPKTSYLASLSAIATLDKYFSSLRIGT